MLSILPECWYIYLKRKSKLIATECKQLSLQKTSKIRDVARVIGLLVASFSAVEYGKLHYRELEQAKIKALKQIKGNYEAYMYITRKMKSELQWWITNIHTSV